MFPPATVRRPLSTPAVRYPLSAIRYSPSARCLEPTNDRVRYWRFFWQVALCTSAKDRGKNSCPKNYLLSRFAPLPVAYPSFCSCPNDYIIISTACNFRIENPFPCPMKLICCTSTENVPTVVQSLITNYIQGINLAPESVCVLES